MGSLPLECTLYCPKCLKVAYNVFRKPGSQAGVYEHVRDPEPPAGHAYDCAVCGTKLERR
jgi:hypothetical protein